jgi:hypothetical protein
MVDKVDKYLKSVSRDEFIQMMTEAGFVLATKGSTTKQTYTIKCNIGASMQYRVQASSAFSFSQGGLAA